MASGHKSLQQLNVFIETSNAYPYLYTFSRLTYLSFKKSWGCISKKCPPLSSPIRKCILISSQVDRSGRPPAGQTFQNILLCNVMAHLS